MKGFKAFLLRGNVVELAVAVVIAVAFGVVITAFVKDMVTPLIAAIGGQPDFSTLSFTVNNSKFLYGDFLNALIAFLIIAAVIYFFVVMPYTAWMARAKKEPAAATKKCPECLSEIPIDARRCAFCGQPQPS
ncbi:MAG TPA: large conductance mechanosensitive channel protein MscL [Candidatus Limnocylindria bacterium]|nr:large conductance mechanosensitive channel protein MscL [Candidatus Limnocylindria bacterium]